MKQPKKQEGSHEQNPTEEQPKSPFLDSDPFICPHCGKPLLNITWRSLVTPTIEFMIIGDLQCRKVISIVPLTLKQPPSPFGGLSLRP